MYEEEGVDGADEFYKCFKYFKQNKILNSSQILDFKNLTTEHENSSSSFVKCFPLVNCPNKFPNLKPFNEWKAYHLPEHPGFIWLNNLITPELEMRLTKRCIFDLVQKPNKTNLDNCINYDEVQNLRKVNSKKQNNVLKKLRWITIGYHHNWDTKIYSEVDKSEMPQDISEITKCIAQSIGFHNFKPEAGIINIYHKNSSLAGHIDNSEYDLSSPIISISLGCTCIFLLGGPDKSTKPTAMYLRSGDVIVMSKEARLNYHAVPCIILNSYENCLKEETLDLKTEGICETCSVGDVLNAPNIKSDDGIKIYFELYNDLHFLKNFLCNSRININTRQVHESKCPEK